MKKLLAIPLLLLALPATAEVYRYVDENGTVVFTDQRPSQNAQPMILPELTIMESQKPAAAKPEDGASDEGEQQEVVYPSLTLISPQREETFQGTGNRVPVRLVSRQGLRPGDQVVIFLNGQEQARTQALSVDLDQVPRGTHEVRAEIRDPDDRVVGETHAVTFHLKQHSRLHQSQPLVNPPPG